MCCSEKVCVFCIHWAQGNDPLLQKKASLAEPILESLKLAPPGRYAPRFKPGAVTLSAGKATPTQTSNSKCPQSWYSVLISEWFLSTAISSLPSAPVSPSFRPCMHSTPEGFLADRHNLKKPLCVSELYTPPMKCVVCEHLSKQWCFSRQ